jgi:SAM-dependent methyltransferase
MSLAIIDLGRAAKRALYRRTKALRSTRAKGPQGKDLSRLHLGCGPRRIQGWCGVDARDLDTVDVIADVSTLPGFPDQVAESIYACHVLEHFGHAEIEPILRRWYSVLKPGGELRISVPDLDRIVRIYHANWKHFQTDGNTPWIGLIYGGQGDQYDFHKTGFNFCWLSHLLRRCGFENPQEYPHVPHFAGIEDASLAKEPFGEYLSLNIVAKRPRD